MSKEFHHIEGSINSISYSCQMIISLIMGRPENIGNQKITFSKVINQPIIDKLIKYFTEYI